MPVGGGGAFYMRGISKGVGDNLKHFEIGKSMKFLLWWEVSGTAHFETEEKLATS